MRLIDADAFLERIQNDTSLCAEIKLYGLKVLKKYINLQPTAYSVNKVIEEVSEIVKQGCVSDASDDVCEWKQDNMCETVYRVCGGFSTTAYQTDFEFCPYCGKKIKIVGD